MEVAFAVAPPTPLLPAHHARHLGTGSSAAQDVDGVTATDDTRAEAGAASTTSQDRALERAEQRANEDREVVRRLTAEDFAAIQEQLGLRPRPRDEEDGGIPGDVLPEDLTELALVDDEAQLTIRQTNEPEDQFAPEFPPPRPPDFSAAVADAVVTIDEYLDWVNEAGGQPR